MNESWHSIGVRSQTRVRDNTSWKTPAFSSLAVILIIRVIAEKTWMWDPEASRSMSMDSIVLVGGSNPCVVKKVTINPEIMLVRNMIPNLQTTSRTFKGPIHFFMADV